MIRNVPVNAQELNLVAAGPSEAVQVWDRSGDRAVMTDRQELDETTGDPLWTVYAMCAAGGRPEVIQVRVPARQQPVLTQFGALEFDGLEVRVNVGRDGKLAGYWSARAVTDPAQRPGKRDDHKPEQPAA